MILIQNMTAARVNLRQNDFAAGLPSPLAFLGLLASLAPEIGVPRWSIGVMPILHQVAPAPGRTRGQLVKDAAETFKSVEIPEDYRGFVRFSMLIDTNPNAAENLGGALSRARLAGGTIFAPDGARAVTPDGSALAAVRRGRVILPRDGLPMARGREDDIPRFWDAVRPPLEDIQHEAPGWRVPLAVGYHLLEDPATAPPRAGTRRTDLPHVFAEPVAGVGELVSPKSPRMTGLSGDELRSLMWRYATAGDRVAAHPFYLK